MLLGVTRTTVPLGTGIVWAQVVHNTCVALCVFAEVPPRSSVDATAIDSSTAPFACSVLEGDIVDGVRSVMDW